MTNSASTPGPWSVIDNSWEISTVYGPDGETVAECHINSVVTEETQYEHEAVKEANARLIAAAPDLLDALKKCRLELDHCQKQLAAHGQTGSPNDSVTRALVAGRAAVAKATGGAA